MAKLEWRGGALLAPVPPAMISCGTMEKSNILTIAWTGIVNTIPPKTYISVRPKRFSYPIIRESGEFVINLTNEALIRAADYCGMYTGAKIDKFAACNLHKEAVPGFSCPMIAESPMSLACRVTDVISLGTHDMFLADIVSVHVDEALLDADGKLRLDAAHLAAFAHGEYFALGKKLGVFGFSAKKKKKNRSGNHAETAVSEAAEEVQLSVAPVSVLTGSQEKNPAPKKHKKRPGQSRPAEAVRETVHSETKAEASPAEAAEEIQMSVAPVSVLTGSQEKNPAPKKHKKRSGQSRPAEAVREAVHSETKAGASPAEAAEDGGKQSGKVPHPPRGAKQKRRPEAHRGAQESGRPDAPAGKQEKCPEHSRQAQNGRTGTFRPETRRETPMEYDPDKHSGRRPYFEVPPKQKRPHGGYGAKKPAHHPGNSAPKKNG